MLLLLRVHVNGLGFGSCSVLTSMSIASAIYYLVFNMKACHSSSVKKYHQRIPVWGQNLLILIVEDLEKVVRVGFLKMTL